MPIVPWEHQWTNRVKRAIVQGSDFIDVVRFPIRAGLAANWTGFAVRGQLRVGWGSDEEPLANIECSIVDPRERVVRFRVPAAVTAALVARRGRWDSELYRFDEDGADTVVLRFVQGEWELSREVTR